MYIHQKNFDFEVIFNYKIRQFLPQVMNVLQDDSVHFFDKLDQFVLSYLSMLRRNPFLPLFIITATNRNPELVQQVVKDPFGQFFIQEMEKAMKNGVIKTVHPHQFLLSLIGMCIFPFVGKPLFKGLTGLNDSDYAQIIAERHLHVMQFARAILSK